MNKFEFIKEANKAKFEKGGRNIDESIDCWGLVTEYYRLILGIEIPVHKELIYDRNKDDVSAGIKKVFKEEFTKVSGPKKNNIVLLKFGGIPIHIGVMINDKEILNLYQNKQILIEDIQKYIDGKRIHGYYTYGDAV